MVILNAEEASILRAFLDAFDLVTTGAWAPIEEEMRSNFGIEDPEASMEEIREKLS